jgi:signal transduction histidine kinase
LLDISKLDARVISVKTIDFDLQNTFQCLTNDFAPLANEKSSDLTVGPTKARVHTIPKLLEQVLRDLLYNAV